MKLKDVQNKPAKLDEGINLNEFERQVADYLNGLYGRLDPDMTPDQVYQVFKGVPQEAAALWTGLRRK